MDNDILDDPSSFWSDVVPARDQEVLEAAGYGGQMGLGQKPALLVVDVTYEFVGSEPLPVLESIKTWRNSCGEGGWAAIPHIATLVQQARRANIPVVYTAPTTRKDDQPRPGRWADKNTRRESEIDDLQGGFEIVAEIAPRPGELVLRKSKPSAFFGTPLISHLVDSRCDSVIVCGGTTSGCVRASATDAFSLDFRVAIAAEATFDRAAVSHKVTLFDLHQKYADVMTVPEVVTYLDTLRRDPIPAGI